jgi:hypothetical protein
MLVDIPAAQHKTMFFIISLDLHVFIDNYPVQTASTTALPRLCVRHHKENGIFLKPVTILTGGEKISRRLFEQCGFFPAV